ncbi:MAG: DUF3306 domain-containing protein [Rhodobacteraceae bacterium]|nr:DUF3306 domain-containing protein [Paracoccaceae bacterium]
MTRDRDFWSRRKAGVAHEAMREEQLRAKANAAHEVAALEGCTDREILADLALPEPETMQPGDNFAAFMRHAVPEHLRQRALRQLWRSDPVLANLDGLNNYDTDFTQSDIPGIAVKTSYEIGKGVAQAVLGPMAATESEPAEAARATPELCLPEPSGETQHASDGDRSATNTDTDDTTTSRGRMRFAYVGHDPAMEAS